MKKLLFILLPFSLGAQQMPNAVCLRVTPAGQVEMQRSDGRLTFPPAPGIPSDTVIREILNVVRHAGKTDSSHSLLRGPASTMDMTQFTLQRRHNTISAAPMLPQETAYTYFQPGRVDFLINHFGRSASDDYTIPRFIRWENDKDGRIRQLYTGTKLKGEKDTIQQTWEYAYRPDGRLENVVIRGTHQAGRGTFNLMTTEWLYDTEGNLIAECSHEGKPLKHLRDSVETWKRLLVVALPDENRNKMPLVERGFYIESLFVYDYRGPLLTSTIGFDSGWSTVACDSLDYDTTGNLVRFRNFREYGDWLEITFTYQPDGKVRSKSEYLHSGCANRGCLEIRMTEEYGYGADGRMNRLVYNFIDTQYPKTTTEKISYSAGPH